MRPNEILIMEGQQCWWPVFEGKLRPCSQPLSGEQVEKILAVLGQLVANSLSIELDTRGWDNYDSECPGSSEGGTMTEEQAAAIEKIIVDGSTYGEPSEIKQACRAAEEEHFARGN